MGGYNIPFSGQRLGKHVPAATVTYTRGENGVLSTRSVPRNYKQENLGNKVIMKMQMFATLDKANRDTGNIRDLNLAAVNHTTVQVTTLLL
jgi:hypothetical protein